MAIGATTRGVTLLLALVLVVTACGEGATANPTLGRFSFEPPPAADPDAAAAAFGADQLDRLLAGATSPPSSITWDSISADVALPTGQASSFCQALDLPGADNALSIILGAGLNALSWRLRKRPLSSDAEEILGIAVTFATKTCPAWDPTVRPSATLPPVIRWYPSGYEPMIFQPDAVAWRWADPSTFTCEGVEAVTCYALDVVVRAGCPGFLEGTIATYDADGVVLDILTDTKFEFDFLETTLVFDMTDDLATDASVIAISCA